MLIHLSLQSYLAQTGRETCHRHWKVLPLACLRKILGFEGQIEFDCRAHSIQYCTNYWCREDCEFIWFGSPSWLSGPNASSAYFLLCLAPYLLKFFQILWFHVQKWIAVCQTDPGNAPVLPACAIVVSHRGKPRVYFELLAQLGLRFSISTALQQGSFDRNRDLVFELIRELHFVT